jgi:nicotinamide mononucleotide (NMN) deamidase PncC
MTYSQELAVRVASTSAVRTALAITGIATALDLSLSTPATL